MNSFITIVTSIIGSGTLSYFVTLFTANRVKKNEFEWDYKKYVLEKRKLAYERIHPLIRDITTTQKDAENKTIARVFIYDENKIKKLQEDFAECDLYRHWYSDEFVLIVSEINHFFQRNRLDNIQKVNFQELKYLKVYEIQSLHKKVFNIYWNDMKNLHNINSFFEMKKSPR